MYRKAAEPSTSRSKHFRPTRGCRHRDVAFRVEFIPCIAMIQRVGPIIDQEAKGHRTQSFGTWWESTTQDPLFQFFKGSEECGVKASRGVKRAEHDLHHNCDAPYICIEDAEP